MVVQRDEGKYRLDETELAVVRKALVFAASHAELVTNSPSERAALSTVATNAFRVRRLTAQV